MGICAPCAAPPPVRPARQGRRNRQLMARKRTTLAQIQMVLARMTQQSEHGRDA
jgi:hypothetical protein